MIRSHIIDDFSIHQGSKYTEKGICRNPTFLLNWHKCCFLERLILKYVTCKYIYNSIFKNVMRTRNAQTGCSPKKRGFVKKRRKIRAHLLRSGTDTIIYRKKLGWIQDKGEATFIFSVKGDPKKRLQMIMIKNNNTSRW